MKIAITAQGGSLEAKVDPRFGRAGCFVIVDPDTMEFEVVDNKQNVQAAAGAGVQAAQLVAEHGATAVLTGNCGPKAFRTLKAADIEVFTGLSGTVKNAITAYKSGDLTSADSANVEAHSGI
ncbi:NifB/NifX family molybdenum-iron cluster-binding protein [Candidatus Poribacteria bacterium]